MCSASFSGLPSQGSQELKWLGALKRGLARRPPSSGCRVDRLTTDKGSIFFVSPMSSRLHGIHALHLAGTSLAAQAARFAQGTSAIMRASPKARAIRSRAAGFVLTTCGLGWGDGTTTTS